MSTNEIDEMTEGEAKELLNKICDVHLVGGKARTRSVILTNIGNCFRRSQCLSAIERHMTQLVIVDGEEIEDCPLRWGDEPGEYLNKFQQATDNAQ